MKGEKWVRLIGARKRRGLTGPQLAERLGVSHRSVVNWELGHVDPQPQQLVKICEILDVPMDYLLGFEMEKPMDEGMVMEDRPKYGETDLWKRRAKAAEQHLAHVRSTLKLLLDATSGTPPEPGAGEPRRTEAQTLVIKASSARVEDAGVQKILEGAKKVLDESAEPPPQAKPPGPGADQRAKKGSSR
jgi:transcriptional regulator with XRE-family HTH domain